MFNVHVINYAIYRDVFDKPAKPSDNPFSRFRQQLLDIINQLFLIIVECSEELFK